MLTNIFITLLSTIAILQGVYNSLFEKEYNSAINELRRSVKRIEDVLQEQEETDVESSY